MKESILVTMGLRVKTGKAIAVLLRGPVKSPTVIKRGELLLADPDEPDTWQPYHVVMDLPWEEAQKAVRRTSGLIRAAGSQAVGNWAREVQELSLELCGVGIVAGSLQDPSKVGNPHIRAHTAEGQLFRETLEMAADALKLSQYSFLEEDIYEAVATELKRPAEALKERMSELGAAVGRPWRAEEKAATAAAWVMLARCVRQ